MALVAAHGWDVLGAQRAGLTGAWFPRSERELPAPSTSAPHVTGRRPGRRRRRAARRCPARDRSRSTPRWARPARTVTDGGARGHPGARARRRRRHGVRRPVGGRPRRRRRPAGGWCGSSSRGGSPGKRIAPAPPRLDEAWAGGPGRAARRRRADRPAGARRPQRRAPGSPAGPRPPRVRPACWRWRSRCTRPGRPEKSRAGRAARRSPCRSAWCRARPTRWVARTTSPPSLAGARTPRSTRSPATTP